ncbi:hemerythrin domain-containing protein [Janibacter melonis]|uniref:hemerythrin domain-containing protein n=1 Tax=Janibacter melonis TaxID=262209 RepID=UPI00174A9BF0|nr:hemerythrin domain-containing protein [Janibacter melonis]
MADHDIARPTSGDIVELIKDDHRRFEELLRELRDTTADRDSARAAFSELLIAHSEAEEEQVYPRLKSKKVIDGEEEEHGEEEHAACNEELLHLLQAKGTDTQKYEDAVEKVATALMHHIGEEELSILNPAATEASEELRQQLGVDWCTHRNRLLEEGCGSLEQVQALVKRDYEQGLLPNDEQPEDE